MDKPKLTISVSQGAVAHAHNIREFENGKCPKHIHSELSQNNIVLKECRNEEKAFNDIFANSVENYNSKQKRNDRKIKNYYKDIKKKVKEKQRVIKNEDGEEEKEERYTQICEYVFQIGNGTNNNLFDKHHIFINDDTSRILEQFALDFEKSFPNFRVVSSVIHLDETVPHLHIAFVPVGIGYKKGMEEQCSMTKALECMGFKKAGKSGMMPKAAWKKACEQLLEKAMNDRGYERAFGDGRTYHYDMESFKEITAIQDEAIAENRRIQAENDKLKKSNKWLETHVANLRKEQEQLESRNAKLSEDIKALNSDFEAFKPIYDEAKDKAIDIYNKIHDKYNADYESEYINELREAMGKITFTSGDGTKKTALERFDEISYKKVSKETSEVASAKDELRKEYEKMENAVTNINTSADRIHRTAMQRGFENDVNNEEMQETFGRTLDIDNNFDFDKFKY